MLLGPRAALGRRRGVRPTSHFEGTLEAHVEGGSDRSEASPTAILQDTHSLEGYSVLKNSLRGSFHPRSGTKYADFGALRARFLVAMSSVPTFLTRWWILRNTSPRSSKDSTCRATVLTFPAGTPRTRSRTFR